MTDHTRAADTCPTCRGDNEEPWQECGRCTRAERDRLASQLQAALAALDRAVNDQKRIDAERQTAQAAGAVVGAMHARQTVRAAVRAAGRTEPADTGEHR